LLPRDKWNATYIYRALANGRAHLTIIPFPLIQGRAFAGSFVFLVQHIFRPGPDFLARTHLLVFIMQLKSSFAALLAGVLATMQLVEAAPATQGMVTLPLKRVEQRSADVHPSIYLQQHINRGIRRLARMTGREVSEHQLRANLEKRVAAIDDETLTKRFNRMGLSSTQKTTRGVKELRKKKG
jgi:hypothetical protein